ncbi:uncharacterized protein BP01DRAFT_355596 [Aspergillus saccharolyticus JOP 1030-1]|uniref:Uncharacterized protein n=1 Tax=Aspergillus saccharolyticus JOP 1030-1 TaxID=1450539 RepID=A0A319AIV6_9EURO|nr:hypothetical protein BP01DRAFT_355596 [Aspergillus saccharolyticus JOP 1030-1]PYH46602.1 hypothetical protein BP01DRAFT_355596 [Aspergillus saccharolyticus JOP 1030-1]
MDISMVKRVSRWALDACAKAEAQGKSKLEPELFENDEIKHDALILFDKLRRPQNRVDRTADDIAKIVLDPSLKPCINRWDKNPQAFGGIIKQGEPNSTEEDLFLAKCFHLAYEAERENLINSLRLRFCYMFFYRFSQFCSTLIGVNHDTFDVVFRSIKQAGLYQLDETDIRRKLSSWIRYGERFELLVQDLGSPGILFLLPFDHGEIFWREKVPKSGHRRDNLIKSLRQRLQCDAGDEEGIVNQSDAHRVATTILDFYVQGMIKGFQTTYMPSLATDSGEISTSRSCNDAFGNPRYLPQSQRSRRLHQSRKCKGGGLNPRYRKTKQSKNLANSQTFTPARDTARSVAPFPAGMSDRDDTHSTQSAQETRRYASTGERLDVSFTRASIPENESISESTPRSCSHRTASPNIVQGSEVCEIDMNSHSNPQPLQTTGMVTYDTTVADNIQADLLLLPTGLPLLNAMSNDGIYQYVFDPAQHFRTLDETQDCMYPGFNPAEYISQPLQNSLDLGGISSSYTVDTSPYTVDTNALHETSQGLFFDPAEHVQPIFMPYQSVGSPTPPSAQTLDS